MEAGTCVVEGCGRPRVRRQGVVYRPVCWMHQTKGRDGPVGAPASVVASVTPRVERPRGRFPWRPPVDTPIVRDAEGRMVDPAGLPITMEDLEVEEQVWWRALQWLGENRGRIPACQEDRIAIRYFIAMIATNLSAWGARWTPEGLEVELPDAAMDLPHRLDTHERF